jgi:hypothetical protein
LVNLQGLHRPQRRFREQCARRSDYPLVAKIEAVLGHRLALVEARTSLLHHAVIIVTDRGEVSAQASGGWTHQTASVSVRASRCTRLIRSLRLRRR